MLNEPPVLYGTPKESKLPQYLRIISWGNLFVGWIVGAELANEFNNPFFVFGGIVLGAISAVAWHALAVIVEACEKYLNSK